MRRPAVLFFVLLAMLWQSVAWAQPGSKVSLLGDLKHAVLHWQQEAHHHHDDGSFHLDDSPASTFHVVHDLLTVTVALLQGPLPHFVPSTNAPPGNLVAAPAPDAFVDGLLRPPCPRA
jgi:hypothetical protein